MAFGVCAGLVAVAVIVACIPDLPPDPPAPSAPACGDGYIDLATGEQCDPGTPSAGVAVLGGCTVGCRMECPSGFVWSRNDHCYQLAPASAAGLQEAIRGCSLLGAHVVTFASEAELSAITGFFRVSLAGTGPFWVGLDNAFARYNSVAAFEPGWSPTCSGCFARAPGPGAALPRLDASTDGATLAEGCVAAFADPAVPFWTEYPCANAQARIRVICEREPVGARSRACDAGVCIDLAWTHGGKRYVYREDPATADAAEQACVALGGSLVVLQSQDEREQLWRELSRMGVVPNAIWIGLVRVTASGSDAARWVWDDDASTDAYPSPWGDRQPRAPGALTTARAFLLHQGSPPSLDDTLAHDDVQGSELASVCQL